MVWLAPPWPARAVAWSPSRSERRGSPAPEGMHVVAVLPLVSIIRLLDVVVKA